MKIIDSNIILRFLTNDVPEKAEKCEKLLERVERDEETVYLPLLVITEIVYVLEKIYKEPKWKIYSLLEPILRLRKVYVEQKRIVLKALELYAEKNIDFTDAWISVRAKAKNYPIYSYDRDFDKIKKVKRIEP